ncbi:Ribosomal RNA small subunit methyltransferase G [Emticicia oligotrophica DSM 17448]|uniref:Ribosomal RNA small subunit methyltransferase G n=1 Tax=Emticicia oligotrophica (strain DSM 17448 / CIP 109782 / MTCC 6937 / GPTSA100-15) TaxID=929562 RepID=A0ABN4AS11_EMTOG|nr:16S rRNA (guanine(527)-N(7))-methyltransferase RsmG [Emticicia oligotrophica]AFK05400.1 Ribosomal RNA small subunit methyltransferase G [Emticicia oligotrophica DSM 17448]
MSDLSLITKYFPNLTETQIAQFGQLQELYRFWNSQINVVSRQDIENLYEKHILHSLGIAKVTKFKPGTEIMDVGTGGGFPGIPLAIMFPDCQFHLVDSIGKKIKVVTEVSQALGLKNLTAQHERAENVASDFDFIVSRAVTRLKPFYGWVKDKVTRNQFNDLKNGILYLKGGDLTEELEEYGGKYRLYDLADHFSEEFFETKKVVYVPF